MVTAAFNKMKALFTSKLDLNLVKDLETCHVWSIALCGVGNCTPRKVDQKYLESFEMWCGRRMEKIGWTNSVKN
jgi:hypothetical protein